MKSLLLFFCITILLNVSHAYAQMHMPVIDAPTIQQKTSYVIKYLGLDVGKIQLQHKENDSFYSITASIKSSGIVRIFSKQKRTVALFGKKANDQYIPLRYHAHVAYPHKEKTVSMLFDKGHIIRYDAIPENDTILTDAQQHAARDPLSVLLFFMQSAKNMPDVVFPITTISFDGKRLNRIYALPAPKDESCVEASCATYAIFRKPLVGYSEKKLAKYRKGEPPVMVTMDTENAYFPEKLHVNTSLGGLYIVPVKG